MRRSSFRLFLQTAGVAPLLAMCLVSEPASAFHHGAPFDGFEEPCEGCDIPFLWDDPEAVPFVQGPLPQGFVLTVPVSPGTPAQQGSRTLNRYAEVASALAGCWSRSLQRVDAQWQDLTLRVSFRRDGSINGLARVAHISAPADTEAAARGRRSLLEALAQCTPLPFSPSLGRAIAGQIFAIRFVSTPAHQG